MPKFRRLRNIFSKLKPRFDRNTDNLHQKGVSYRNISLYDAARRGDVSAVQRILSKHESIQEPSQSLRAASSNGHADVVLLLLQDGVDANATDNMGYTALHRAVYNGHGKVVRLLVEHGADPFLGSVSPMEWAERLWNEDPLALFQELVRRYYPEKLKEQPASAKKAINQNGLHDRARATTSRGPWPDRDFLYKGERITMSPSNPAYWD
ncbi:hypothetical protein N7533_003189 [Penicillium manginii]|uniref:uncharacterized protein n=1 Tax=Penicillium manginii TaxID=203109 RepID=UPI002548AEE4|nr:uncharacterized protein N7533_003189 [Penicillium manginii]KAJ5764508.1 hypothetical protein N7533_003189 [Penicillium manginii]